MPTADQLVYIRAGRWFDVAAFLASDAARWVSGQNIRVNGAALW